MCVCVCVCACVCICALMGAGEQLGVWEGQSACVNLCQRLCKCKREFAEAWPVQNMQIFSEYLQIHTITQMRIYAAVSVHTFKKKFKYLHALTHMNTRKGLV